MSFGSSYQARFERTWGNPSWWNLIVVFPLMVFVIFSLFKWRADEITAAREQTALALIVSHDPPNHDRFGYQFGVNGMMYTGWAIPSAGEYEISQRVVVYYDPLDPSKSQLADFAGNQYRMIGPASFCLFGICGVPLYIFLRRRAVRYRRVQRSPSGSS